MGTNQDYTALYNAILKLKSVSDCEEFFSDLCTIKELKDMAQRFETAILLKKGQKIKKIEKI